MILNPTNWSVYNDTGIPKNLSSTWTHVKLISKVKLPGITFEPSLKKWVPNCSTWFCRIDCKVVSSLAWTGDPGLKRTLEKFLFLSKSSKYGDTFKLIVEIY